MIKWIKVTKRKARVAMLIVQETLTVAHRQNILAAARYAADTVRGILKTNFGPCGPPETNVLDMQFGTDTAGEVKLHSLDIRSPNYQYAVYYRATDYPILTKILERLALRHENYTFIDYGSGKGFVLLHAAGYPFKKVIGIEFARELHETAQHNVDRYPAHLRRSEIELVYGDAVEFTPPPGNLVLYFYDPFEPPVTRQVIARIREFCRGRDVIVAYVYSLNPTLASKSVWDAEAFLSKVDQGDGWTIYRAAACAD